MKRSDTQVAQLSLIAFLGNPGNRYARTRHNAGRLVGETPELLSRVVQPGFPWKEKFNGSFIRASERTLLIPETFMNQNGRSVQAAAAFFSIPPGEILVVHDDMETSFGTVQLAFGGGHRGNNGVRSVEQHLGERRFWRLRIGVGRPPAHRKPADWLLERFTPDEEAVLPDLIHLAVAMIMDSLSGPQDSVRTIS